MAGGGSRYVTSNTAPTTGGGGVAGMPLAAYPAPPQAGVMMPTQPLDPLAAVQPPGVMTVQPQSLMQPASVPPPPGAPAGEPPKPPAAFDPSVPRGWNDPPPMSASKRVSTGSFAFTGQLVVHTCYESWRVDGLLENFTGTVPCELYILD